MHGRSHNPNARMGAPATPLPKRCNYLMRTNQRAWQASWNGEEPRVAWRGEMGKGARRNATEERLLGCSIRRTRGIRQPSSAQQCPACCFPSITSEGDALQWRILHRTGRLSRRPADVVLDEALTLRQQLHAAHAVFMSIGENVPYTRLTSPLLSVVLFQLQFLYLAIVLYDRQYCVPT